MEMSTVRMLITGLHASWWRVECEGSRPASQRRRGEEEGSLKDVETDVAVLIDVRVEARGLKFDYGGRIGVGGA